MDVSPYESPKVNGLAKRSPRFRLRIPVIVLVLGCAIVSFGFWYDVLFAGIPYQDPTPAMQAQYNFDQRVASLIRLVGEVLFAAAAAMLIVAALVKTAKA